jgi:hypothetical protein
MTDDAQNLPDFSALAAPVALVAHDAGATNILIGWLKVAGVPAGMRVHVAGPAATLWRDAFPHIAPVSLAACLSGAATLVSGSGWSSLLEHEARGLARQAGITTIAAVDHWVNYKERFVRDGVEILPDEIWVADHYALAEAQARFPGLVVRQFDNAYLRAQANAVRESDRGAERGPGMCVLYALEPIRLTWGGEDSRPGEFQALDYFISRRAELGLGADSQIRLRPHPSDAPGKYDAWIRDNAAAGVALGPEESTSEAVAWSDMVVGCESFMLIIGLAAGRKVVSTLPPWGNRIRLPHRDIVRLCEL